MEYLYSEETGRKNNFDFLRCVLAIAVMFTHSFFIYSGLDNKEPFFILSDKQLTLGTLAVNFFFIISGFLVLQSWQHSKSLFDYLKKRILRIYPGFVMVCFVCALIVGPMGTGTLTHPFAEWKSYVSGINWGYMAYTTIHLLSPVIPETFKDLPQPNDINTSLWTIWYEFVCYIIILSMGILSIFKPKWLLFALFFIVVLLNILHHNPSMPEADWHIGFLSDLNTERLFNMEHFALCFLAGSCFFFYRNYIPKSRWLAMISVLILLVNLQWIKFFEISQALFGSYLLFYFVFSKKVRLYNFAKFGDFSYGIYLYGWPVQQLVMLYFGTRLNVAGTFFTSLIIVFPIAFCSWHLVEKQFLKLKQVRLPLSFVAAIKKH